MLVGADHRLAVQNPSHGIKDLLTNDGRMNTGKAFAGLSDAYQSDVERIVEHRRHAVQRYLIAPPVAQSTPIHLLYQVRQREIASRIDIERLADKPGHLWIRDFCLTAAAIKVLATS